MCNLYSELYPVLISIYFLPLAWQTVEKVRGQGVALVKQLGVIFKPRVPICRTPYVLAGLVSWRFTWPRFLDVAFILQIEGWWQPRLCCHFSNSICSFHASMSHCGNWQHFKLSHYCYTCYGALWSVIFCLGCHKLCPFKLATLINKCVYSDCSINQPFSLLFPSP